ncbi:keratinocyte proline-rich protein-like [Monodelphis domestica]|uniref:keratinocyte proline-rich protein-like n=1 Tax=Monodelphis domestica TaxID=13616 RepID=UPI0024E1BCB8|nr:keratinocyte proline-rich protein-like [Monodelphis domestica]
MRSPPPPPRQAPSPRKRKLPRSLQRPPPRARRRPTETERPPPTGIRNPVPAEPRGAARARWSGHVSHLPSRCTRGVAAPNQPEPSTAEPQPCPHRQPLSLPGHCHPDPSLHPGSGSAPAGWHVPCPPP